MAYQFCPRCGVRHRRVARVCNTEGCGYPTIIVNKNMQALAQRLYDCDFSVLAATSSISDTADKSHKSVRLSIEFMAYYDIDRVFIDLPDGWSTYHTFSVHSGIVIDNITELNCSFVYFHMGFCNVEDEIRTEVDKMIQWLSNSGHIACLRLAGFFL